MNIIISLLLTSYLITFSSLDNAAEIQWSVVNRFPLFNNAGDFQKLESAFPGSASNFLGQNLSSAELRKLLPIHETAWNAETGSYNKSLFETNHLVRFVLSDQTLIGQCVWKLNESPAETHPCNESVKITLPENTPFDLEVYKDDLLISSLNEQKGITSKVIVGLGDSFASGEGNPDHPTIFNPNAKFKDKWFMKDVTRVIEEPVDWWDRTCHRSLLSWQVLYAMHQAIADPHRVVKFASFACSGAEIYDGFFNPQKAPPGSIVKEKGQLKMSQHDALISLLCETGKISSSEQKWHDEVAGPSGQKYFGKFQLAQCSSSITKVDELLLSFGGNDIGFSGVVRWGIAAHDPKDNGGYPGAGVGIVIANVIGFKPISPGNAASFIKQINPLYKDLELALRPLNISPKNNFALIYPDPLPKDEFEGCRVRMRDGNVPFSLITNHLLPLSHFKFGLRKEDVKTIQNDFIRPLREAQYNSINSVSLNSKGESWVALDANEGFSETGESPRTICSSSNTCNSQECDVPNRLTWVKKPSFSTVSKLINLSDYKAYAPERSRGMRYASDALLTQSGKTKGRIDRDWVSGVAHPTAAVHANIADRLFSISNQ